MTDPIWQAVMAIALGQYVGLLAIVWFSKKGRRVIETDYDTGWREGYEAGVAAEHKMSNSVAQSVESNASR